MLWFQRLSTAGPETTMTHDDTFDDDITTDAEFEAALTSLLTAGHRNGLTVTRPWLCRTDDGVPNFETVVVELDEASDD